MAHADRVVFHEAFGHARLYPEPALMKRDSIFDLASLTKPLGAALAAALLVERGDLEWDSSLGDLLDLPDSTSPSVAGIRVRHLLEHSSGLPAFRAYYRQFRGCEGASNKERVRSLILREPLWPVAPANPALLQRSGIYAARVGDRTGHAGQGMDQWLERNLYRPLGLTDTGFGRLRTGRARRDRFAQTAYCAYRKRYLQGEVHDRNAFAMGGFSGHAGLFASARDVHTLLNVLYRSYSGEEGLVLSPKRVRRAVCRPRFAPGEFVSNGIRYAQRPEGSSAGTLFPRHSVGHLGFTGASFWMDLKSGFSIILLTNRLLARPRNSRIRAFRPR